ncbi:MAG: flagellar basal body P-ring formation protein FlgA [candidate division Zixibacteria bacterium]|nr:flagellar basal body P-ring formation protein FlgA [candidate division Zixibacteria bacterium]
MKNLRCLIFVLWPVVMLSAPVAALDSREAVVEKMFADFNLDPEFTRIEVQASQLGDEITEPFELEFEPLSQKAPLGLFTVNVSVSRDGAVVDRGQVRFEIRKFAEVLVTTGKIKRHEILTEDKMTLKMMDITSLPEQPVNSLVTVNGYRSKRNLSTGRIVTLSAVEPVPDIEVGREVSIICANGLFSVRTSGKALQDGWAGDYVKVKNENSGKIVLARVVDEGAVVVDP